MDKAEYFAEYFVGDMLDRWDNVDAWRGAFETHLDKHKLSPDDPDSFSYLCHLYDEWRESIENFEGSLWVVHATRKELIKDIREGGD